MPACVVGTFLDLDGQGTDGSIGVRLGFRVIHPFIGGVYAVSTSVTTAGDSAIAIRSGRSIGADG